MPSPPALSRRLAAGIAVLAGALGAGTAAADTLDLEGTWYVLIHYRDPKTANPDVDRWKDLVWVFTRKGSRLEWTEYPIVFFEDQSGRFEALGNNPRTRVLGAWEPNAAQRRTIDDGPRVNRRGMRTKTLRGSDDRGWSSPRSAAGASATVMTYQENLTVDGLDALPRFLRADVVGNAVASSGGGTRYEVEKVGRDGRQLTGHYERDGRQTGTFRMWRTQPVRGLPEKGEKGEKGEPGEADEDDPTPPPSPGSTDPPRRGGPP